jgi:hypothetical protein
VISHCVFLKITDVRIRRELGAPVSSGTPLARCPVASYRYTRPEASHVILIHLPFNTRFVHNITRFANQAAKGRSFTAPFHTQHYADRISLDMGFALN